MDQPRFVGGRIKGTQLAAAAFVLSLVLLLAVGGISVFLLANQTTTTADFSSELRDGLVESCELNGDPLRAAVRNLLREQIRNTESPLIKELFPTLPQSFIDMRVAALHQRLAEVKPVVCNDLYPKP